MRFQVASHSGKFSLNFEIDNKTTLADLEKALADVATLELGEERVLYLLVAALEQSARKLDDLRDYLWHCGHLDDELHDEVGRPLVVQVALHVVEGHLGPQDELAARSVGH